VFPHALSPATISSGNLEELIKKHRNKGNCTQRLSPADHCPHHFSTKKRPGRRHEPFAKCSKEKVFGDELLNFRYMLIDVHRVEEQTLLQTVQPDGCGLAADPSDSLTAILQRLQILMD